MLTVLEERDGPLTSDYKETAACFSEAFSSVFVQEPALSVVTI